MRPRQDSPHHVIVNGSVEQAQGKMGPNAVVGETYLWARR